MQQGCAVCAGAKSGAMGECSAAAASRQAQRGSWVVLFRHQPGRPLAEGDHHQPGYTPKQTSAECCAGRMHIRYASMLTMAYEQKHMQWQASATACTKTCAQLAASVQAHKFLTGYAPIRSMARVGAAAGALLAIPAEQLKQGSHPRTNAPPVSRQVQRGLTRTFFATHLLLTVGALHHVCLLGISMATH